MSIFDTTAGAGASILDPISALIKNPFSIGIQNRERPADFPGGFLITEYPSGKPDLSTALVLAGNMMPFQPFEWSTEQRLVKEYYPGNAEPSVQVLGPKRGPWNLKGRFKDKRFNGTTIPYGTSFQYSKALDEMCQRGNLLKFGMHGAAGDLFRWGYLEKVTFRMNKQSWIDYEFEFFVIGDKQPDNDFFAAQEKAAPAATNQKLMDAVAAFETTYSTVPSSMPQSLADVMNGLIGGVAKNINLVTGFVNNLLSTAQSIQDAANRAIGLIKAQRSNLAVMRRKIDAMAHNWNSLSSQGNASGQATDTYKNIAFIGETLAGTVALSQYLAQMQAQFEAIALTVPKARYRVQKGDTLQNISNKFYGAPGYWTNIYDANKLTSTTLTQGAVLIIPHV